MVLSKLMACPGVLIVTDPQKTHKFSYEREIETLLSKCEKFQIIRTIVDKRETIGCYTKIVHTYSKMTQGSRYRASVKDFRLERQKKRKIRQKPANLKCFTLAR